MIYFVKFGETFLKSKSTKKKFVNLLIKNLKERGVENIEFKNAYLLVKSEGDILDKLITTFGVQKVEKISFIKKFSNNQENIVNLLQDVLSQIVSNYNFETFRISAKRENKQFYLNSMEISQLLGKYIEKNFGKKASYKNYDLEIKIRVLKDDIWVWTNKDTYEALGGLPYGIEGKALNLFSGGIDSPVATFLAAKRGIKQDFLFLNIPNSQLLLQQVFEIYNFLKEKYGIKGKFYTLNIKDIVSKIKENVPAGTRQIVFKYFLYQIAENFSNQLRLKAVVNGENLGQVSTQTFNNMTLLDKSTQKFHIRPLICMDKTEIIDLAKKIGTYDLSSQIKETCSLENHSDTKADLNKVKTYFESLNINFDNVLSQIQLIEDLEYIDFQQYKTDEIKGELIDLEKEKTIPKLEKGKIYTFKCNSGYKASQACLESRKKGFETYYILSS